MYSWHLLRGVGHLLRPGSPNKAAPAGTCAVKGIPTLDTSQLCALASPTGQMGAISDMYRSHAGSAQSCLSQTSEQ